VKLSERAALQRGNQNLPPYALVDSAGEVLETVYTRREAIARGKRHARCVAVVDTRVAGDARTIWSRRSPTMSSESSRYGQPGHRQLYSRYVVFPGNPEATPIASDPESWNINTQKQIAAAQAEMRRRKIDRLPVYQIPKGAESFADEVKTSAFLFAPPRAPRRR
jgi:hypothetical protein